MEEYTRWGHLISEVHRYGLSSDQNNDLRSNFGICDLHHLKSIKSSYFSYPGIGNRIDPFRSVRQTSCALNSTLWHTNKLGAALGHTVGTTLGASPTPSVAPIVVPTASLSVVY
jgi:hypothetical protein